MITEDEHTTKRGDELEGLSGIHGVLLMGSLTDVNRGTFRERGGRIVSA